MKVRMLVAAVAAVALASLGGVAAAAPKKANPTTTVKPVPLQVVGTLKAVDASAKTVTITVAGNKKGDKGKDVVVKVAADAKVTRNGKAAKLDALKAGDHVQAMGSNGVATKVIAEARSATTTTTAPSSTTTTAPTSTTSTTAA